LWAKALVPRFSKVTQNIPKQWAPNRLLQFQPGSHEKVQIVFNPHFFFAEPSDWCRLLAPDSPNLRLRFQSWWCTQSLAQSSAGSGLLAASPNGENGTATTESHRCLHQVGGSIFILDLEKKHQFLEDFSPRLPQGQSLPWCHLGLSRWLNKSQS
jgi:hypothetical protein